MENVDEATVSQWQLRNIFLFSNRYEAYVRAPVCMAKKGKSLRWVEELCLVLKASRRR